MVEQLEGQGVSDLRVLAAMRKVPRHEFVPEELDYLAYANGPVAIGYGQTISQPYIVALMTDLLNTDADDTVLEVGTGSGYQAAVLAHVAKEVFTVERLAVLINSARRRFQDLRLRNIRVKHADGMIGWPEHAPFDGILATAAPEGVPPALLAQLAVGGRLVIPVGDANTQTLVSITRTPEGYRDEVLDQVSFVPMRAGTQ